MLFLIIHKKDLQFLQPQSTNGAHTDLLKGLVLTRFVHNISMCNFKIKNI